MQFIPVKTRKLLPPKDDIYLVLNQYLPQLKDGDILFITSKVLAIHQGRTVPINGTDKKKLIYSEAESTVLGPKFGNKRLYHTIKGYTLIPTAGIDESNSNGYYTLWPTHTQQLLKQVRKYLMIKYHLKKLGVVATDSHTTPLRSGTLGICIGFTGFHPTKDYRGKRDLFARKLVMTKSNIVDAISAMAVLLMGEGQEQTPLLVMRSAQFIRFTPKDTYKELVINPRHDIYSPLLKKFLKSNISPKFLKA